MRTFSETVRKNIYACIFGPLAIIPASIVYALGFKVFVPEANQDNFELIPLFIIFGLIVSYTATILIGLPVSIVLQKLGKFNLSTLLVLVLLVISIMSLVSDGSFYQFLFSIYFSLIVASACWYLHKVG